ncbi:hypothetical protein GBAR_LOCUS14584, partial [Geodia barretti]
MIANEMSSKHSSSGQPYHLLPMSTFIPFSIPFS